MLEIFKDIPSYEGLYQVSNLGNVKSLERCLVRKNNRNQTIKETNMKFVISRNYFRVSLSKNNVSKKFRVHQLVAMAFLNHIPCKMKLVVNHKNLNKLDNRLENLEIISQRKNANKKHIKSTSKYVGVTFDKRTKKWYSQININNKNRFLGRFENEYDAHLAYQKALKTIHCPIHFQNIVP